VNRDWYEWHLHHDDATSSLSERLAQVRSRIWAALDEAPPGPLTAISVVAGQGRDLIPVLATHPRGADVTARLVELDPRNTEVALALVAEAGLTTVEVVTGDASTVDAYAGLLPADVILLCGLFGNITDDDIRTTISAAGAMTRVGGTVVWTRGGSTPGAVEWVASVFEEAGFERVFISAPGPWYGVGAHRYAGPVRPLPRGRMFTFVGRAELKARGLR
jgi:hypothetical protein